MKASIANALRFMRLEAEAATSPADVVRESVAKEPQQV
jgi:hypothetical protein